VCVCVCVCFKEQKIYNLFFFFFFPPIPVWHARGWSCSSLLTSQVLSVVPDAKPLWSYLLHVRRGVHQFWNKKSSVLLGLGGPRAAVLPEAVFLPSRKLWK
jgi:uncharacterized membrane protein YqaE (UPF0057 family)